MLVLFWYRVISHVDANVSEIHTASIFSAERTNWHFEDIVTSALKMEIICVYKTLASTYETTWRQNQNNITII
jgi:hypothetical protein